MAENVTTHDHMFDEILDLTADVFLCFIIVFAKVRFFKCTSSKIVPKAIFAVHF